MNTLAILRGTFGNFRPPLLTTSATWLLTTTTNRLYRKRLYAFPKLRSFGGTFGNFQPLSSITSACVNRFIQTYHYLEQALSWRPKCLCQIAFNVMNALTILGGTFGNFRPLSSTTSVWSIFISTYHYFERALFWTLKCLYQLLNTIQINEHSRNASGVLSVTHDHYHWLLQLVSIFIYTYHYFVHAPSWTLKSLGQLL